MTRKTRSPRRRGSGLPKAARYSLVFAALVLVAAGFFFGYRLAQPPPPPDFSALESSSIDSTTEPSSSSVEFDRDAADTDVDSDRPGAGAAAAAPSPSPYAEPGAAADRAPAADRARGEAGSAEDRAHGAGIDLARQPAPGLDGPPRIALVIDDLGRSLGDLARLRALGVPITYSVLPFEVRTREVVASLRETGEEVLCHLPMEARGGANPGPGALRVGMSDEELVATTRAALDAVPGAVGANNHMGSAVMADRRAMMRVLDVLDERSLFFLDSRTTAETLGYSLARQRGLVAAERQVFLDPSSDRATIEAQFQVLLETARRRGAAIAIAHPYASTLEILEREVPKARQAGFEFVHASRLAEH